MLLDRLNVEAFRGIRNSLEIPLDASITVLLAANGTAKTSVCDAVEWLLTGRVRRLQAGLVAAASLQNRYATDTPPRVQATANWAGVSREIERTESDSIHIPNVRGGIRKATTTAKLLEHLTPEYVGQTTRSRNVEEPRAEWLRTVRFFSPDGLALLLDDGEDAERVRGIAFAQLLGVGPVGRRIEGLKGVRAQIDSPRAAIANVLEKIASHEARLKAEQASVAGPYVTRVDALLREVATFCKLTLPETLVTRREVLLSLRDRIASLERALESERSAHAKVKSSLTEYGVARAGWKTWLEEQKPGLEKALLEAQRQRDDANRQLHQLTTGASELANRLGQLNIVLGQTQTTVATVRLDASSQDASGTFALAQTRADRDEAAKNAQKVHAQFELLKRFAGEFPGWQRAFLELDLLEKQRLELSQSIPSVDDQEGVERRLRETTLALAQLRQQISTSTDRWQRWGAEVKAQAPNWTTSSACPLCGHDHQSPEQLRAAIEDVLSRQPAADAEMAARLAQFESAKAELQTSAATIAERRRQLLALEQKIVLQKAACANFQVAAKECGFDESIFARADAPEAIANRLRIAEQTAGVAHRLAGQLDARAGDVLRWHNLLQGITEQLRAVLPSQSSTAESLPSDPTLQQRMQAVEALMAFAQARAQELRGQSDTANQSAEQMRAKLPAFDATIRQIHESLEPLAKSADDARKLVQGVEECWQAVSTAPLDSDSLLRVATLQQQRSDQLREQSGRLMQAEQNLGLAERAMRDETDRSEASKAIAALKNEHAALLRVDLLRTRLDSAIEQAEQDLNRLLSTQIRPLLRSISSLYLRTQGISFVDSIGVDDNPNSNALRWLGQLADAKPLSAVEMSQGQRQDLALSIFLARARRERGTFILDEPLAHLDDLNRVAFFDTLRAMIAETSTNAQPFRLVMTTASWSLVRHLRAKFFHVKQVNGNRAFRVLELVGDPRSGIDVRETG
jgi:predicted ATPase